MQCHLHFLIFPVFPIAARKHGIQLPFSFLLLQSLAAVAVWVAPNQLAKKSIHLTAGQNGRGEVEAGEDHALQGSCFWQAAVCPQCAPACSEGLRAELPGTPFRREGSTGGHILSCSSAPGGQ